MNMKQLRYFYEIANEKQITRAAKKLHIAQPPLSQSLKALETRLGVQLFERNGRQMVLTEAGKVLYEKAKIMFQHIDETIVEVKETGQGMRGTLAVGSTKSCFSHVPQKLKHFLEQYPNVRIKLIEGDSYFLTKQLLEREIEAALVRLPIEMNGFQFQHLPPDEYVAIVPNRWLRDEEQTEITIEQLASIPLVLLHRIRGIGQFEIILNKFKDMNLEPQVICESPNVDMLLGLVNEGIGATIIPKASTLKNNVTDAKILQLKDVKLVSESAIIWLENRYLSKSATHFIELFK